MMNNEMDSFSGYISVTREKSNKKKSWKIERLIRSSHIEDPELSRCEILGIHRVALNEPLINCPVIDLALGLNFR